MKKLFITGLVTAILITAGVFFIAGVMHVIVTGDGRAHAELACGAEYFVDRENRLSYEDVINDSIPFARHEGSSFQLSLVHSPVWIKCRVPADINSSPYSDSRVLVVDNVSLKSIILHVPVTGPDGRPSVKILKGGWEHGTRGGEFHFIYPSFKLPRNMDPSRPLVMHVSTPLTLQFRMTLYSMEGFWRAGFYLFLIIGFCSGILVTMLLSNMVLYAHMIEKQYFIYMLYVAATLFYQSSLFGLIHYVAPWSDRFIMPNITVPGSAMIICYLLFTVFFLETEHTAPRCNIVLRSLVACNFIFIAMMFLGFQWLANLLTYLGATVAVIAVFITALSSLRSGYLPARYFIIAAGVFLASSMIFLLKFYGVLPSNTLTMNIMFFGSSAESILLSLALRYRIKVMQEERQFLRERGRMLERMSFMDELTGLYNRRFMNETLKRKITEARRNSADLSLLMMDLDDFKKYNDSYGHIEGDRVLAAMGNVLIRTIRGADVACRYGGEEFLVILGNTDSVNAIHSAERIRSSLRQIDFKPSGEGAVNVTVSIGAVSLKPEEGAEDLIARADRALYMAKEGGRDRVVSI